jgi:hypothetical protein
MAAESNAALLHVAGSNIRKITGKQLIIVERKLLFALYSFFILHDITSPILRKME